MIHIPNPQRRTSRALRQAQRDTLVPKNPLTHKLTGGCDPPLLTYSPT